MVDSGFLYANMQIKPKFKMFHFRTRLEGLLTASK